ncbi:PH domain-containing protein [Marinobacter lacisalsi]|uniref:PH domain-containing protein n=1 Tax=Marinobacter lacisalsi TaxID=475979 RepID=A0ABV8QKY6_9GAMM
MDNYESYAEYTRERDWKSICKLNEIELDSFGTKKELKALPEYLEPNEVVFALTSGMMDQTDTSNSFDFGTNTWLVVLTSDRFLFLDAAMLTSSVDSQSIRHDRVQAVSGSQGFMFGKISVDLGSRMLVIDNCHKSTVKVMASLANRWIKELGEKSASQTSSPAPSQTPLLDLLERLEKLRALGALSDQEFNDSKEKLLSSTEFRSEKDNLLSSIPAS